MKQEFTNVEWLAQKPKKMKSNPELTLYPAIIKGKQTWVTIPE